MKRGIRMLAAAAIAVGELAGCGGARYRDVAANIPVMVPDTGRIYFYQPPAPGSVLSSQPYLRVNGTKVGPSKPGSFFFINPPPGTYRVDTMRENEFVTFDLAPGQTRYVRLSIEGVGGNSSSVGTQVMRMEDSETLAQQEMAPLKYWGAGSRERVKLRR